MIPPQIIHDIQEIEARSLAVHRAEPSCIARDYVSERVYQAQLEGLMKFADESQGGKRLLEIGSGFGMFLALARSKVHLHAYGVEPEQERREISHRVLGCYGLQGSFVAGGVGESLPYKDESFDFLFSANVLEHSRDPGAVLRESLRVLKKGGVLQFIIPNFNSFFEGHYGIFWIPCMPKGLARLYVKLWRRDPAYLDTLQFTTLGSAAKILETRSEVAWIHWGEQEFMERLKAIDYPEWKDGGRLARVLGFFRWIGLLRVIGRLACKLKCFTPIILTLGKKGGRPGA
jgi:ubiquinone/menaquinone biosynthesis C-methylase UbiE